MTFDNNIDINVFLQNEHICKIFLMKFLIINKKMIEIIIKNERLNFDRRQLLYQEFPMHMT